jgi:hypothetical protein
MEPPKCRPNLKIKGILVQLDEKVLLLFFGLRTLVLDPPEVLFFGLTACLSALISGGSENNSCLGLAPQCYPFKILFQKQNAYCIKLDTNCINIHVHSIRTHSSTLKRYYIVYLPLNG